MVPVIWIYPSRVIKIGCKDGTVHVINTCLTCTNFPRDILREPNMRVWSTTFNSGYFIWNQLRPIDPLTRRVFTFLRFFSRLSLTFYASLTMYLEVRRGIWLEEPQLRTSWKGNYPSFQHYINPIEILVWASHMLTQHGSWNLHDPCTFKC